MVSNHSISILVFVGIAFRAVRCFPHFYPHVIPVKTGTFLRCSLVFSSPLGDNPLNLLYQNFGCYVFSKTLGYTQSCFIARFQREKNKGRNAASPTGNVQMLFGLVSNHSISNLVFVGIGHCSVRSLSANSKIGANHK